MSTDESDEHCGYRQDKSSSGLFGSGWDSEEFVDNAQWDEDDNCLRDPWTDQDRCVWHAETKDKSANDLIAIRANGPERLDGAYLADVELNDRFSFAGCQLHGATLSRALLWDADLSGADLTRADLSGANLWHADLSGADLRVAALAGVVLGNTDLSTVKLDHRTRFTPQSLGLRLKSVFGIRLRKIGFDSDAWNKHARDAHNLAATCSEEGLIRQARALTIWDRHARRNEALSNRNILTAFGSWLNWQVTGYGLSVDQVSRNMLYLQ